MTAPPLVVIGAGPIGLAAASNARSRGMDVVVLEAGDTAGHAVRQWGHVRLFSPWSELVDPVGERLLVQAGWQRPPAAEYPSGPTGHESTYSRWPMFSRRRFATGIASPVSPSRGVTGSSTPGGGVHRTSCT
jgi:2-polyprenyl-6-methoxyphenol hydroxylase-like FAD-dependent oxidoreductase